MQSFNLEELTIYLPLIPANLVNVYYLFKLEMELHSMKPILSCLELVLTFIFDGGIQQRVCDFKKMYIN